MFKLFPVSKNQPVRARFLKDHFSQPKSFISIFLTIVFSATTITGNDMAWAQSASATNVVEIKSMISQGSIPSDLGILRDYAYSQSNHQNPFVVHIQDAHSNVDAQKNIHQLLSWIHQKNNIVIGLEGAVDEIRPEYLEFFPEYPEANEAVVQDLLQKGELNGTELFAWEQYKKKKNTNDYRIVAAEDVELYATNLQNFRELSFQQDEINILLHKHRKNLEVAKSRIFNADLNAFLKERDRRKNGNYSTDTTSPQLSAYLSYLSSIVQSELGVNLDHAFEQVRFPNMVRILVLAEIENSLSMRQALSEKEEVINLMKKKFKGKEALEAIHELENLDRGMAARQVVEKVWSFSAIESIDLNKYSQYKTYLGSLVLNSEVDAEGLFEEMAILEHWLLDHWSPSQDEKKLVTVVENFEAMEKLLTLRWTTDDLANYKRNESQVRASFLGNEIASLANKFAFNEYIAKNELNAKEKNLLTGWVNQAINFYEVALQRDEALLEKTLAAAKKDSVAVIVSGGYHTDGLVSRMRAKEMNYAVIQPVIQKNDGGALYHKALKDENADVSNYFNANALNKQEALFFKQLMEVAAPKLWDVYQVPHNELGEKVSHVVNTHDVLSQKIQAISAKQQSTSQIDFTVTTKGNEVLGVGNNAVALTPNTTEAGSFARGNLAVRTRQPKPIAVDDDDEDDVVRTVFSPAGVTARSVRLPSKNVSKSFEDAQFSLRAELRTVDFNAFEGDDLIKNLAALNEAIADPKNGAEKEALENLRKGKYTTAVVATLKELSMNMMSHYPGQWEMMGAVARAAGDENLHHRFNKLPIPIIRHIVTNDLWASVVADKEVANLIWRELEAYRNYMSNETTWVSENAPELADKNIFYFSAEYGNQLFSYTGGLGILAGDHLRGMSDLGMTNFRAIGLLYQFGYFEQRIEDGRQKVDTEYTGINREDLPLIAAKTADGKDLIIDIPMVGKTVKAKVWKATHGKREVYMLDTRLEENKEEDRNITDRAYHSSGGSSPRMEQYYVLGVGGAMAMEALGVKPDVIHSNDSHPFFTIIREIAMQMKELEEQISDQETRFNKALKTVSAKTVFTTHTPIEAGNEIVSQSVLRPFLEEIFDGNAYAVERILSMGAKFDTETSLFNPKYFRITNFQMNVAAGINGVSKLHGAVSQKLNKAIFPGDPADEVDILGIVNSVHAPFWQQPAIAALFEETLSDPEVQALIRMDLKAMGEKLADKEWVAKHIRVDSAELDEVKRGLAKKLFEEIKFRARGSDVDLASDLEADALTIGFARRFIEYKRALLIFKDIPRLKAVAKKANKPIQLIFAGKAHPDDKDSQKILEQLLKYAAELNQEGTNIKVVFVENYNIELARPLESGTDAWLNTPIVGEEASGTSGPKAGLNGGINISTKDGWNIEGIVDDVNGYLFGVDSGERDDEEDARQLYDVIEEVIRLYDTPGREEWLEKVKAAVLMSVYRFGMERMLSAYATQLYAPASTNKPGDERQEAAIRQQFLAYSRKNNETNPIKIENFPATIAANTPTAFDLTADLSGLDPKDVGLDVMIRRQGQTWQWFGAGNPVATLEGENYRYQAIVNLPKAGEYEVKIRLTPRNQTAWKNTDEHNFVTRYYEAPNRLEVLDRRLVEARAKSSIEKGFLFSVQLPSLPQGTEVFWESLATAWQERAVKMNDLKDGFYTVVIPAETTGSGYHEFKMFTRSPDGTVNWFTGNYPVAADTNAYVTIPHANDPATANNPLFDRTAAQRILNVTTSRSELRATVAEIEKGVQYHRGLLRTSPMGGRFRASRLENEVKGQTADFVRYSDLTDEDIKRALWIGLTSLAEGDGVVATAAAGASSRMNMKFAADEAPEAVAMAKEIFSSIFGDDYDLQSKGAVPIGRDKDGKVLTFLGLLLSNVDVMEKAVNEIIPMVRGNRKLIMTNRDYHAELDGELAVREHYGLDPNDFIIYEQELGATYYANANDVNAVSDKLLKVAKTDEERAEIEENRRKGLEKAAEILAEIERGNPAAVVTPELQPLGHGEFDHQLVEKGILLQLINEGRRWIHFRNIDNAAATYTLEWIVALGVFLEKGLSVQPEVSIRVKGQKGGGLYVKENGRQELNEDPAVAATFAELIKDMVGKGFSTFVKDAESAATLVRQLFEKDSQVTLEATRMDFEGAVINNRDELEELIKDGKLAVFKNDENDIAIVRFVTSADTAGFNNAVAFETVESVLDRYRAVGQSREDFITEYRAAVEANDKVKLAEIAERGRAKLPLLLDPKPAKTLDGMVTVKAETNRWQATAVVEDALIEAFGVGGIANIDLEAYKREDSEGQFRMLREATLRMLATKQWAGPAESYHANKMFIDELIRLALDTEIVPKKYVPSDLTEEGTDQLRKYLRAKIETARQISLNIRKTFGDLEADRVKLIRRVAQIFLERKFVEAQISEVAVEDYADVIRKAGFQVEADIIQDLHSVEQTDGEILRSIYEALNKSFEGFDEARMLDFINNIERAELRSIAVEASISYVYLSRGVTFGDIRKLRSYLEAQTNRFEGVEVSVPNDNENEIRVRLPEKDGVTSVVEIARRDEGDRLQITLKETSGERVHSLDLHLSHRDSILRAYEGIRLLTHLSQDHTSSYLEVNLKDLRAIRLAEDENGLPSLELLFDEELSKLPLAIGSTDVRGFRASGFSLNAFAVDSSPRAELRTKLEKNPIFQSMAKEFGIGLLLLASVTAGVFYYSSVTQPKTEWTPPTVNQNVDENVANEIFSDLLSESKEVRELAAKKLETTSPFMQEAILIRLSVANTSSYYPLLSERAGIGAFSEEERNNLQRVEAETRRALDLLILNFGQFDLLEGLGREKGGREVVAFYTAQVAGDNPIESFEQQLRNAEKVSETIAVIRGLEYLTKEADVIWAVDTLERLAKKEQDFIGGWKSISEQKPITTATMLAIEEVLPKLKEKLAALQAVRNELRSSAEKIPTETGLTKSALPVEVFESYKTALKESITAGMAVDYQELDANTITLTFKETMEVITINREEQGGSLSMTLLNGRDRTTLYLVAANDLGRNSSFSVSSNGKPIHTLSSSRIKVNLDVLQGFALTDPVGQGVKLVVSFDSEEKNLPINSENRLAYTEGVVNVSKISFSSTKKSTRSELRFALTETVATDDVIARIRPLVHAISSKNSFRLNDSSSRIAEIASGIYATASDIASRNQVSEELAMAALISELLDLKAENPAKLAAAIDLINFEIGPEFAAIFSALTAEGSVAPTFTATLAELQAEEVQLAAAFILRANPNNHIRFVVVDDDGDETAVKYTAVHDQVAEILRGLGTSTKDLANRLQIKVVGSEARELKQALTAAVNEARGKKNSRGFVVTENAAALKTLPKFVEVSFGDRSSMKLSTTILLTPAMSGNSLDQGVVAMLAHFESRGFDMTTLGQQISNIIKGLRKLSASA